MKKYYVHYSNENISFSGIIDADELCIINNSAILKIDGVIVCAYPADKTIIRQEGLTIKPLY